MNELIPSGSSSLTPAERSRLDELETTIRRGLQSFMEAGQALAEVRDSRLYRASFTTFEEYCRDRWNISRPRAYELMASAEVVSGIPDTMPKPTNAGQAVELARVPVEHRVEVWEKTVKQTGGKPTAAAVRTVREQVAPHLVPPIRRAAPAPQPRPATPLPPPVVEDEIVDAEIVEDARRDAELNALLAETDVRFRANFSAAMAKADDVWQFNVPRIAEVYGNPSDRQRVLSWLREMTTWCDRVSEALSKTTVLRSVGGDR